MNRVRQYLVGATVGGAAVVAVLVGQNFVQNVKFARAAEEVQVTRQQLSTVTDLSNVFKAVGKAVEPSVVQIQVHKTIKGVSGRVLPFDDDTLKRFFPDRDGDGQPDLPPGMGGDDNEMEQVGTGSGVIMEVSDGVGYILTNNHVAGGATEMDITLADGREIKNGKLLGADPKSDLAVVKIEADKLIPAKWGNSDALDRGDWVLAFGSPFGFVGSMTHGIVSALNRQAGVIEAQGYENFIQVDAPINPGNSGGPLVNLQGEVVGINTAIASRSGGFQGIGFAIPSNQAKYVYTALKDSGHVSRGWLGVGISDVDQTPGLAKNFGYSSTEGVLVEKTYPDTPADGKLMEGDIISAVNGKPVANTQALRNEVAMTTPGKEISLTVFRDGKNVDVTVKLGEQPDELSAIHTGKSSSGETAPPANTEATIDSLGLRLSTPTDAMLDQFHITDEKAGALVIGVKPHSLAATSGLRPGDLITSVDSKKVTSIDEAADAIKKGDLTKGIRLYIVNADTSRFVIVTKADAQ